MQRYFFHTQTDTRFPDAEGIMLQGAVQARSQVIQTCGQMLADAPEGFWGSRPWSVTVTNAAGLVLWEIAMDGVACQPALA